MVMERIAALDPGREKCGFAVLAEGGEVLMQRVIETAQLEEEVRVAREAYGFAVLVEGNGTTSREARARLQKALPDLHKKAYWKAKPPRGWRRLLPVTMQVPPEPVDDFVAVILASRYIKENHHE